MEKSRQEKRKEARLAKNARKNEFWLQRQKPQKHISSKSTEKPLNKKDETAIQSDVNFETSRSRKKTNTRQQNEVEDSKSEVNTKASKAAGGEKKVSKRALKTKFEKFFELDNNGAEDDLELERKLAKKLKVKGGKLKGEDLGLNMLFEDISCFDDSLGPRRVAYPAVLPSKESEKALRKKRKKEKLFPDDSMAEDPEVESEDFPSRSSLSKRQKKQKSLNETNEGNEEGDVPIEVTKPKESCETNIVLEKVPAKTPKKYVAPHLRSRAGNELEEYGQIRRQLRGLLNRLSESNVEPITGDVSVLMRSIPRGIASDIFGEEVLASCAHGPRGNEQHAAVFAAFVAGTACSVGIDFSAKLLALLAKTFEDEYHKEDNISLRNLTLLLSQLCTFGVCSSDLIYDFLIVLSKRLTEIDVSTILTVLQCCGMKIRAADPLAMKNFIASVQNRVNEVKLACEDDQEKINGRRMEFMLETICDIKNNKKRPKEDTAPHTRIKKWLQKLRAEDILISGLNWSKLLDPNKKGQWWLSGDTASTTDNVEEVANTIDKEVLEAQKLLQLAAAQRMNTDARRAIFCIIMSGEDYIDAFEKLRRLDLHGKQDREIMRVLVECCLQEKVFNKYYTILASKLCEHDKNHKFTLQFCLWDHFKQLDTMQLSRSLHLAKFVAEMVAKFTLSLAVLKTVDLADIKQLTAKRTMHFRMLFEAIFEYPDSVIWNIFTRVAVTPELESLRDGIEFFIKYIVETNKSLGQKFKLARKALNNTEGVLR
ncbi:uncharacterized protein LOC126784386 [Argentina anserina]|uniref:uncharacterized protein LOC126784386 n=1 Tax=Argentina anserina TaxID=57926 RepID=UPI0021765602|nr:uncharacterized protein LOC126784386 [Potentilla anserina]